MSGPNAIMPIVSRTSEGRLILFTTTQSDVRTLVRMGVGRLVGIT
jgi:hypothetical protein